jgi:3',5'-cyclic AMP phosphodiesterase CpdA
VRHRAPALLVVCVLFAAAAATAGEASRLSITKGPYVQNVTTDAITVMWETSAPSDSRVEYGAASCSEASAHDAAPVTVHEVRLTGLDTDAIYHYRVASQAAPQSVASADHTFQTAVAPTTTSFRFAAYGDTRSQADVHAQVVKAIIAAAPRFVLHTGDLVADGTKESDWQTGFFGPAEPLMANTVMFPVLGNHERNSPLYYQYFEVPEGGGDHRERWYSFTYGDAKFIGIDTEADFSPGSPQYVWLADELQRSTSQWLFVFQHVPAYSSGAHGGSKAVQDVLVPLYERYGVDVVFCGHDHLYERSVKRGVQYVVTGGGGAPLYRPNTSPNPYQARAAFRYHFCTVDIDGDTATLSAVDTKGEVFDRVTLTHAGRKAPAGVR